MTPLTDPSAEAQRVLGAAQRGGVALRLLGGIAIKLTCPSAEFQPLARHYKDLDFATIARERKSVISLFLEGGYQADEEFNALHGKARLFFWDPTNERQADVFIDRISMCHTLEIGRRIEIEADTLPLADLLLLKLQVFETNDKDYKDALAILLDHSPGPGGLDVGYIAELLAADWGWWRTSTMVLERLDRFARELEGFDQASLVHERVRQLLAAIEGAPKTRRWKLRSRIGERTRWYELPEETVPP